MNRPLLIAIWFLAGIGLTSFFLPWTKLRPAMGKTHPHEAVQQLTREDSQPWYLGLITIAPDQRAAALHHPLEGKSGWQLWIDLREKSDPSAELIHPRRAQRAFWIYAIPATALLAAALVTLLPRTGGYWGAALTLGTYLITRINLRDASLEQMLSDHVLGIGVWIGLYALLGISIFLTTLSLSNRR